jgi:hypoxanthine phosphoribosyltransferase
MIENIKVLYSEEEIQKRIAELAEEIDKDYNGEEIVGICVLKGAVFFTVDLIRKMKTPVDLEFMQISSYLGTESTGVVNLKKDLEVSIENKDVLIIEDIVDSGNSMKFLVDYLKTKNPKSLKLATLLDKKEKRKVEVNIDYTGFVIPNKFIVGYGFDIDEKCRDIPYLGYIE